MQNLAFAPWSLHRKLPQTSLKARIMLRLDNRFRSDAHHLADCYSLPTRSADPWLCFRGGLLILPPEEGHGVPMASAAWLLVS